MQTLLGEFKVRTACMCPPLFAFNSSIQQGNLTTIRLYIKHDSGSKKYGTVLSKASFSQCKLIKCGILENGVLRVMAIFEACQF